MQLEALAIVPSCTSGSNKTQSKLRYDSSDATVMGMAEGYDLEVHRRFVGSLRKSGFKGTIMLATEQQSDMK